MENDNRVLVIAPSPSYRKNVTVRDSLSSFSPRNWNRVEYGISGEEILRGAFLPSSNSLLNRALNQVTIALGSLLLAMVQYQRLKEIDVVIGTVPSLPTAAVSYLIARKVGKPYIIDLRDAWPDLLQEHAKWNEAVASTPRKRYRVKDFLLKVLNRNVEKSLNFILSRASGIIVTSEDLGHQLRKRFSEKGDAPPVETIRNVFPAALNVNEVRRPVSRRDGLNVLYAGTLGRAQNLRNVIVAASIARAKGVDVRVRFVGTGASVSYLKLVSRELGVPVIFGRHRSASALKEYYEWADTALVHLTGWEPLSRAVPSKTFELMSARIHISGVVQGEAARLIERLGAGNIVAPDDPEALAALWQKLSYNRDLLCVGDVAKEWVDSERELNTPVKLIKFLQTASVKKPLKDSG